MGTRAVCNPKGLCVHIRTATMADATAVGQLNFRSHKANFAPFAPPNWLARLEPQRYVTRWTAYLQAPPPGEVMFLAHQDARLVAMMGVRRYDSTWRFFEQGAAFVYGRTAIFRHACMEPDVTRTGIGSQLYTNCMQFAIEQGYHTVIVDMFRGNVAARRFAEKCGFKQVWERTLEGDPNQGDVMYRLLLPIR